MCEWTGHQSFFSSQHPDSSLTLSHLSVWGSGIRMDEVLSLSQHSSETLNMNTQYSFKINI